MKRRIHRQSDAAADQGAIGRFARGLLMMIAVSRFALVAIMFVAAVDRRRLLGRGIRCMRMMRTAAQNRMGQKRKQSNNGSNELH